MLKKWRKNYIKKPSYAQTKSFFCASFQICADYLTVEKMKVMSDECVMCNPADIVNYQLSTN